MPNTRCTTCIILEVNLIRTKQAIFINNAAQLPAAAARLSRSLREQYVLGYRPANRARNDNWRNIRVRVKSDDPATRLRASYKKGYFGSR